MTLLLPLLLLLHYHHYHPFPQSFPLILRVLYPHMLEGLFIRTVEFATAIAWPNHCVVMYFSYMGSHCLMVNSNLFALGFGVPVFSSWLPQLCKPISKAYGLLTGFWKDCFYSTSEFLGGDFFNVTITLSNTFPKGLFNNLGNII